MKRWKVGIVGLSRGRGFVRVFGAHPEIEVAALCDIDPQRLAQTGEAFNLKDRAMFTAFDDFVAVDLDIVMIATPIRFHAEQTVKALEAGRHVLCEQTAAYTIRECEQVVQAVKRSGRQYMMAENYCYFHYVREWKKLVNQGKLGHIYHAEGEYVHEIINLLVDEKSGKYFWRHERPPIWYCAHTLGPLLMLMDDRIVRGCGRHAGFHRVPGQSDHPGFLDMEVGLFETCKGATVKILRSQVAPRYPHLVWYSLYGTRGYVENDRADDRNGQGILWIEGEMDKKAGARRVPCPVSDPNAPPEAAQGGHGTSEYYMIRDFLNAVKTGARPPIDVMRAMDFTVPGIIAHESALQGGAWMDVPLFDW
jgi:predicted dehydrogenase